MTPDLQSTLDATSDLIEHAAAEFREYVAFNRQAEAAFQRYWALWKQIPACAQMPLQAKIMGVYAE